MLERLKSIVQQICQLDLTKPLVAGVSGGPDSLCLLDVLCRLGFSPIVAHLNHGLRPEADREAAMVETLARRLGVPFISRKENVAQYAEDNALSLEEAARTLRYRFLFEQAARLAAQAVVVAHTADDQVETVLMHFLRGAGLSGLRGMLPRLLPNPWSETIPLVRPLLTTWREEVLAYCRMHGLEPALDSTNLDTRFTRNRLRHETLPYLERHYPALRQTLLRTSQVLAGDEEIIEGVIATAWSNGILEQGEKYVAFSLPFFLVQQTGVQRRLLRRAMAALRSGLRDVDFEVVERALDFLKRPSRSFRHELASGLTLFLEGGKLYMAAWEADIPVMDWPQIPPGQVYPMELAVPGQASLSNGWLMVAQPLEDMEQALHSALANNDPYQVWLNAEALQLPLLIHNRQPGDRFQPLGMAGRSQKVSDFMINVKLPRRARQRWPLVFSGAQIAWVPGYRLAHPFRLTSQTRRAVHLRLVRQHE